MRQALPFVYPGIALCGLRDAAVRRGVDDWACRSDSGAQLQPVPGWDLRDRVRSVSLDGDGSFAALIYNAALNLTSCSMPAVCPANHADGLSCTLALPLRIEDIHEHMVA